MHRAVVTRFRISITRRLTGRDDVGKRIVKLFVWTDPWTLQREEIWSCNDAKGVRPNPLRQFPLSLRLRTAGTQATHSVMTIQETWNHFCAISPHLHMCKHTLIGSSSPSRLLKANETSNNYRLRNQSRWLFTLDGERFKPGKLRLPKHFHYVH